MRARYVRVLIITAAQPGKHTLYDCSKAESLGITFTSAEDSIKSTALDLKKWGHFATPLAAPAPAPAGCDTRKILYATFTASPGKEAEVASLIAGLQEKVRQEPGNLVFQATTRQGKPGEFFVYEEYVDEAAFQVRKRLLAPFYDKIDRFYQDRLGTNMVKTQKRVACSYRLTSQQTTELSLTRSWGH